MSNAVQIADAAQVITFPNMARRPRPSMRMVRDPREIAWDPAIEPLFVVLGDGTRVRAGDARAIVRPGMERWPLGIVSGTYKVTPHLSTIEQLTSFCASAVVPCGRPMMAGHGYHVVHAFSVRHGAVDSVCRDLPVTSKLVVAHDHTGSGALRAAMVIYVAGQALGAVVYSRAIHVSSNPTHWQSSVDAMVESSILAQDAVLTIIGAAVERVLTVDDRAILTRRGFKVGDRGTLLEVLLAWNARTERGMTWGVWERRMSDAALVAACEVLGREKYGAPLDAALRCRRFGE